MRRFYLEYKDNENLRQPVAEIPWGHNFPQVLPEHLAKQATLNV
jgi:predicted nuclease of restriction endonuclease-like (RecB) superfamily